jgi:hypothetical protein
MSQLIINGKTSNIKPRKPFDLNRIARFQPLIFNGLMPIDIEINGIDRMPILSGCVLNLPFYHPILGSSSFKSLDKYQHTCTNYGSLWTPNGRKFDALDDYIRVDHHSTQQFPDGGTICTWIRPNSNGEYSAGNIQRKAVSSSATNGYIFRLNASITVSRVVFRINEGVIPTSADDSVRWGVWTFVVVTFSSAGLTTFYINGEVSGTPSSTNPTSQITETRGIEISANSGAFDGIIGEELNYGRVLTPSEVRNIYLATRWRYQ